MHTCSLLVSTYNWDAALAMTLRTIRLQSRLPDEVIITDDGSTPATLAFLQREAVDFPVPLRHVWHDDTGFRLAAIRNRGIMASRCDYVITIDGDLALHRDFVADHMALATPGSFLQGSRVQATPALTDRLLSGARARIHPWMDADFKARHSSERRHALHWLTLAQRKAASGYAGETVMGCNMSFWRDDLVATNGFDERMEGYGSEDLELDLRLRNRGLARRRVRFAAMAIHLEHCTRAPPNPEDLTMPNNRILKETADSHATRCELGMDRYAAEYATPPPDLRTLSPAAIPARTAGER